MWLSRKLTQHEKQNTASAETGAVTIDSGEVAVFSSGEDRDVRIAAPGGFFWRPISGEKVLVIKGGTFAEEPFIVGAVQEDEALPAGEIRIAPAKGAPRSCCTTTGAWTSTASCSSTGCRIFRC